MPDSYYSKGVSLFTGLDTQCILISSLLLVLCKLSRSLDTLQFFESELEKQDKSAEVDRNSHSSFEKELSIFPLRQCSRNLEENSGLHDMRAQSSFQT